MDELLYVSEFLKALMMEMNAFEGISCHKLAFGPKWFANAWLHHWFPTSDGSVDPAIVGGEVIAMISHCKGLEEIGVVVEDTRRGMANKNPHSHWVGYILNERDNLQSQ